MNCNHNFYKTKYQPLPDVEKRICIKCGVFQFFQKAKDEDKIDDNYFKINLILIELQNLNLKELVILRKYINEEIQIRTSTK